jgi:hypothetical protein
MYDAKCERWIYLVPIAKPAKAHKLVNATRECLTCIMTILTYCFRGVAVCRKDCDLIETIRIDDENE